MADIIKVDVNDETAYLEAMAKKPMQLSTQTVTLPSSTSPDLVAGLVEEIGGVLYIVDAGDVTPTGFIGGTSNLYLYLSEDGDGTASAFWSQVTVPVWNSSSKGYYNGNDKCIGLFSYDNKTKMQFFRNSDRDNLHLDSLQVDTTTLIEGTLEVDGASLMNSSLTMQGSGTDIDVLSGDINANSGDIVATSGNIVAGSGNVTAGGYMYATGDITSQGVVSGDYFDGRSTSSGNTMSSGYYTALNSLLGGALKTIPARGFISLSSGGAPYTIIGVITDIKLNASDVTVYYADNSLGVPNTKIMTNTPPSGFIVVISF